MTTPDPTPRPLAPPTASPHADAAAAVPETPTEPPAPPATPEPIELAEPAHAALDDTAIEVTPAPPSDQGIYDVIEPDAPARPAPPTSRPPPAIGQRRGPRLGPNRGSAGPSGARIDAQGVLDDFDDDADFSEPVTTPTTSRTTSRDDTIDSDPDLDPAAAAIRVTPFVRVAAAPHAASPALQSQPAPQPARLPPQWSGPVRTPLIIGGSLLLVAALANLILADSPAILAAMSTLYLGLVHSCTGVVAIIVAAREARRPLGRVDVAAARMLVACAAVLLVLALTSQGLGRFIAPLLAVVAYAFTLRTLFGWTPRSIAVVASAHFVLWLVVYIGQSIVAGLASA